MISWFKKYSSVIKIWFCYILVIHSIPFLLYYFGLSTQLKFNLKTYLFDFWGYFWDGALYLQIAQEGYSFPLQAFFPGFPIFLKFLDLFLPLTLVYKINTILTLPLLIQFDRFLKNLNFSENKIKLALISFLCFPTSFFLQANYTETIYILLSVWGINQTYEKRFFLASLIGLLLGSIKITSVVYSIFLFLNFFKELGYKINFSKQTLKYILFLSITFFGTTIYFGYLQFAFNDYKVYFKAQAEWGRGTTKSIPFVTEFREVKSKFVFQKISEVLIFLFGIFLFIYTYKKIPHDLYLFSLLHFLIPLSTGTFFSINRLFLLSYPVLLYFLASISSKKSLYFCITFIMLLIQLVGLGFYINGHFVG